MIKIVSTTIILVLKLAHQEYQRNKFTFSVTKDEECLFSGQKQTNMELHRSAHLGVRHNLFLTVLHSPCTVVDVLIRLNSLINAKHAMYQKCQRKKHFLSRNIICRVAGIPSLGCGSRGQRSSCAMGLISKTAVSFSLICPPISLLHQGRCLHKVE